MLCSNSFGYYFAENVLVPKLEQTLITHFQGQFGILLLLRSAKVPVGEVSPLKYDGLNFGNLLAQYESPPAECFREEVKNVKTWFSSHNF